MTPERILEMSQCMKMHLTSEKYDYLKYNGKKRQTSKNNNLGFAFGLARKFKDEEEFLKFLIANHIEFFKNNSKVSSFIGDFTGPEAMNSYKSFDGLLTTKTNSVSEDLKKIFRNKDQLKEFDFVLSLVLNNQVNLYTIVLLNKFTNLKEEWRKSSVLYDEYELFLRKIFPFTEFSKENFSNVLAKIKRDMI